jgi:hypothetical protein
MVGGSRSKSVGSKANSAIPPGISALILFSRAKKNGKKKLTANTSSTIAASFRWKFSRDSNCPTCSPMGRANACSVRSVSTGVSPIR